MAKAIMWSEVRAKAVREGRLDEQKLAEHKARMIAEERAYAQEEATSQDESSNDNE